MPVAVAGGLSNAKAEELLSNLHELYNGKKLPLLKEFDQEREANLQIVKQLGQKLPPAGFDLVKPIGVGSTATVWVVHHKELDQDRALKVPRPDWKLKDTTKILIDERQRLAAVNHQNVIRIYGSGEVKCKIAGQTHALPYFIMEYLPDFDDFDKALLKKESTFTDAEFIAHFRDALTGIAVLHSQNIVHCDIKPGNLLIAPGKPTVVTDLGYAKVLTLKATKLTEVRFTVEYAHPDLTELARDKNDPNAYIAPIKRSDLRYAFDLYAFGRTMQDVLSRFREKEQAALASNADYDPVLTPYQWSYLSMISKRLLDGRVERRGGDWLKNDVIPGLGEADMEKICYSSASEALIDFEKLLHLYDLESNVPELTNEIRDYIQIPNCRIPLTQRVRKTISHPTMSRLGQVSQLGFVSSIYPGAQQTRLEHVLGAFAQSCEYVRALWYDHDNCLFQCIMSKKDIECVLVAALIHDVAQYPMAHDLTEVATDFSHEEATEMLLCMRYPGSEGNLAQIVESEWRLDLNQILRILNADSQSTLKERILHSIIDGPIDADKLDYLKRDSTHLGVQFGLGIDGDRLVRHLTVVYNSKTEQRDGKEIAVLDFAGIGVHEKALTVANSLAQARKDMFTQVYWQHTVRCMKAMLGFAVRKILQGQSQDEKRLFFEDLHSKVFDPLFYRFASKFHDLHVAPVPKTAPDSVESSFEDDIANFQEIYSEAVIPNLGPTDDAILLFLLEFAKGDAEKEVLKALRSRRLYRRIAVLTGEDPLEIYRHGIKSKDRENEVEQHKAIYDQFRNNRFDEDFEKIEKTRVKWQENLVKALRKKLPADAPPFLRRQDEELDKVDALILVDIPVKNKKRGAGATGGLWYLTEDSVGVHPGQYRVPVPQFEMSRVVLDDEAFDKRVGKIRVFAHPSYRDLIVRYLDRAEILSVLTT